MDERDEKDKKEKYDLAGGQALTEVIAALLNDFPGLAEGEKIAFATLRQMGGMAMFPGGGAVVESERRSVTGRVRQVCRYPFAALYRQAGPGESGRARIKEWLDQLGRWLGRQSVALGGQTYRLETYPALSEGRRLLDFSIQAPAYLYERDEHQVETWAVEIAARYENIFYQ